MKKGICLFFVTVIVLNCTGCFITSRPDSPADQRGAVWISEEPYIRFEVPIEEQQTSEELIPGILNWGGKEINISVLFNFRNQMAMYNEDAPKYESKRMFRGPYYLDEDQFTVRLDEGVDEFFEGKYDAIEYHLQEEIVSIDN